MSAKEWEHTIRIEDYRTPNTDYYERTMKSRVRVLSDWVRQQKREGRDVLENLPAKNEYRMRPLRPEDV